ncbi:MAG: hypothetical protein AAF213_08655 [Pseudomonadota bacterium]
MMLSDGAVGQLVTDIMPFRYYRLMLPLSDDGAAVTHVLVYVVPGFWWAQTASDIRQKATPE